MAQSSPRPGSSFRQPAAASVKTRSLQPKTSAAASKTSAASVAKTSAKKTAAQSPASPASATKATATRVATTKTAATATKTPTISASAKKRTTSTTSTSSTPSRDIAGTVAGTVGSVATRPGPDIVVTPEQTPVVPAQFTRRVLRPRDLVVLDFTFVNLRVKSSGVKQQLERVRSNDPAYIVVGFPSQHLLEQAFFETAAEAPVQNPPPAAPGEPSYPPDPDKNSSSEDPGPIPVQSRLAGASRLVFRLPNNVQTLPYTLADVLQACRQYELSVTATATPPEPSYVLPPGIKITDVARLAVSPSITAAAAMPKATSRSRAAQAAVAQAMTSVALAESRNQWYAKRSPLARDVIAATVAEELAAAWELLPLQPKLAAPTATQTAIEAPTRLILSPSSLGAWVHALAPVESAQTGRVELWHTRLALRVGGKVDEKGSVKPTVRAIWSPDVRANEPFSYTQHAVPPTPFRASLDQFDRHNIVHLSANHQLYIPNTQPRRRHKPLPVQVERMMLSSLGAWLNVRGAWDPPAPLSVEEWRHRATLGRDHYVRVVYAGALYPFGHRASLIKVTERKFHPNKKGNAAFLRQRMFIVVREPYRLLGQTGRKLNGESLDLKMPLKSARLTTLVTPNLDNPEDAACAVVAVSAGKNPQGQSIFWPFVGGKPFLFHLQFQDESGARIDAAMPLFFVGDEKLVPGYETLPKSIGHDLLAKRYTEQSAFRERRRTSFNGQRVQFAPTDKPGDTSFEVAAMEFSLAFVGTHDVGKASESGELVPGLLSAAVTVPALKHLARNAGALPEVKYPSLFLKGAFAATGANKNPGQVFLELVTAGAAQLDFSSQTDRSGGLLAPNVSLTGLSRTLGPVGGPLDKIARDGLNPPDFFGNLGDKLPKLFGCIAITDILKFVGLGDLSKLPRFMSENLTAAQAVLDDLARVQSLLITLQGQLTGLGSQANALASACADVVPRLNALLADPLSGPKRDAFRVSFSSLADAARALRNGLGGLAVPEPVQFAKTQLNQLLGRFTNGLEAAADVIALADRIADSLEAINEQRLRFEWRPELQSWPASAPIFQVLPDGGLVIAVELSAQSAAAKEPSFNVACRLQKFDLNLIAPATFLKLHFNKLEFTATSRGKPDVNVDFGGIEFVGVLSFVETLRTLIPLDGFSDPPALEISEQGIEASFSLGLPNIAVGVFSLSNLSLGASLTVPFLGQQPLSVRFNFCERSDPFRLTVWIFGGGGFFAVTVTPAGVQILEAAFEFGAAASLDFGVASGSVSVMAGIYFRIEMDEASLTGYFNLKGRVSVLGLITASLELSLELTYEFSSGKCVGRASLIIEVEVLFFSASVEISCEKRFAGSNGDPSFAQIMAPYDDPITGKPVDPWAEYCSAFAA